jgi:lysophospholipid acyltransferase (LPLAT)-like uncharacterized protein
MTMTRLRNRLIGSCAALVLLLMRATCRYRVLGDARPALRAQGIPYIYALLHAHQIAAVFVNDEARGRLAAMVSRSADGELLVPSLSARGVLAARGSSRRRGVDKGGLTALAILRELLKQRIAVLFAVDGPRGPRNRVHRGVAVLPQQVEGAVVLPTMVLPDRRWILSRTWDRMQIPKPFSTVSLIFAPPIEARPMEGTHQIQKRIAEALDALEAEHDPDEARRSAARRVDPSPDQSPPGA